MLLLLNKDAKLGQLPIMILWTCYFLSFASRLDERKTNKNVHRKRTLLLINHSVLCTSMREQNSIWSVVYSGYAIHNANMDTHTEFCTAYMFVFFVRLSFLANALFSGQRRRYTV